MNISEILWKAANEHLLERGWPGSGSVITGLEYICHAVRAAQALPWLMTLLQREDRSIALLLDLGMDGTGDGFNEFSDDQERQQVRYAWLMFASMLAQEMEEAGEL